MIVTKCSTTLEVQQYHLAVFLAHCIQFLCLPNSSLGLPQDPTQCGGQDAESGSRLSTGAPDTLHQPMPCQGHTQGSLAHAEGQSV